MKVILKGGEERNQEIMEFFRDNILPILNFGIAIEWSENFIVVLEKKDGKVVEYIDPTAEVIVELTEEARDLALNTDISEDVILEKSGIFFDEAMAIRKIEELKPSFSREYYTCRYSPAAK